MMQIAEAQLGDYRIYSDQIPETLAAKAVEHEHSRTGEKRTREGFGGGLVLPVVGDATRCGDSEPCSLFISKQIGLYRLGRNSRTQVNTSL